MSSIKKEDGFLMRMRRWFAVLSSSLCLLLAQSCDFSKSSSGSGGGTGVTPPVGGPGGPGVPSQAAPVLLDLSFDGEGVTTGTVVSLFGLNFSQNLSDNKALFTAGLTEVAGLPLRVTFPSDGDPGNGLESELRVVVPGGVTSGNVTVVVNDVLAGARGYSASPQVMAVTLGRNGDQEAIEHLTQLGFIEGNSFLELWGINFGEISDIRVSDPQGNGARIPINTVQRTVDPFDPNAPPPTGYQRIGFSFRDDRNDIRLSFGNLRDNVGIVLSGPGGSSNSIQIPVVNGLDLNLDNSPNELGPVISGVKVPTGVHTGPVRIHYSFYEGQVAAAWHMDVSWKLTSEPNDAWRTAKPLDSDSAHSGSLGVLAGSKLVPTGHRLLPGGGSLRAFVWDAPRDPAFCDLNRSRALAGGQDETQRFSAVHFRLKPRVDAIGAGRAYNEAHEWITPAVLYYYMEELPGSDETFETALRTQLEGFQTDAREDSSAGTASWGPPDNPGALEGRLDSPAVDAFGAGTEEVVLNDLPLPEEVIQFYTIDTDRMSIVFNQLTPAEDPDSDDVLTVNPRIFANPGAEIGEFHFASFTIEENVAVLVSGSRPFVLRLSGIGVDGGTERELFRCAGLLDCSGFTGESTPIGGIYVVGQAMETGGGGGLGGPGGGFGGNGASLVLSSPTSSARVQALLPAEDGQFQGGGGGETTAAVGFTQGTSKFWGAPGGGGGHSRVGGDGDPQTPAPVEYQPPRGGQGGPARGEPTLVELTPGSGGGGGGATITRLGTEGHFVMGGAGGGGGGGICHIVADGSVVVTDSGLITARGGEGGSSLGDRAQIPATGGNTPGRIAGGGPGGGGSGGTILVQVTGAAQMSCDSLDVEGGLPGISGDVIGPPNNRRVEVVQNLIAGAGVGAPGYIKIETSFGAPSCPSLTAETELAGIAGADNMIEPCLPADRSMLALADASDFPPSGRIVVIGETLNLDQGGNCAELTGEIGTEEMVYFARNGNNLEGLGRGANGTEPLNFNAGARVVLRGALEPFDDSAVLPDGGIVQVSDPIEPGRGRDGELQIRFLPSLDPATGEPLIDATTGEVISIWTFDTDSGVILTPEGEPFREVRSDDPSFLDVTVLLIDENTILRGRGSRPMVISVAGLADIAGTIDVGGGHGGGLRFSTREPTSPQHGVGGEPGPGGGAGGDGGFVTFVDGDLSNKAPANTLPQPGQPGGLPPGVPEAWDQTPVPIGRGSGEDDLVVFPALTRPTGGATARGQPCDTEDNPGPCETTAGGGAGGGNSSAGGDANVSSGPAIAFPPFAPEASGAGGSVFGISNLRFGGDFWPYGGVGGAGGGAFPQVSASYKQGIAPPGSVVFGGVQSPLPKASHAPGTGGGGGGGVLRLVAENLLLRETGRILSRGGDAFQSIDLGGNGGGGAGGNVLIQARNSISIAPGASIDVRGGRANQSVPFDTAQQLPVYEGNLNRAQLALVDSFFGGVGGDGAPGRVRVEVPVDSNAFVSGFNPSVSGGSFSIGAARSVGVSLPFEVAVGPGQTVRSVGMNLEAGLVRYHDFGLPLGTSSVVLWEGAPESLDRHGFPGEFRQRVKDIRELEEREFVRFRVPLLTNVLSQETQSLREVRVRYSYAVLPDTDCLFIDP